MGTLVFVCPTTGHDRAACHEWAADTILRLYLQPSERECQLEL